MQKVAEHTTARSLTLRCESFSIGAGRKIQSFSYSVDYFVTRLMLGWTYALHVKAVQRSFIGTARFVITLWYHMQITMGKLLSG